uniref:Uncharacterized protein n=1 Tax=Ditylum brightwellii TaxID=49249 RepID=A0A6V2P9X7_9STRA|mmetsp:Transcript_6548/g.8420  ORF Transcript_6548/g.8420 Transcript_6548/m.8420 type:complete len:107 (-) Transcript_6548:257-577(-)
MFSKKNDETIIALQKRVEFLESSATFAATQQSVQDAQAEMLEKLRSIREAIAKDGSSSSANTASSKEMEALMKENEELKKKNAKQAYRIEHLVSSIEELLSSTSKQ